MRSLSNLLRAAALILGVAALTVPARAADLDKLAPADAEAAVVLNVKSLFASKAFQILGASHVTAVLKNEPVAKFLKVAGFDPVKDLTSVTATAMSLFGNASASVAILMSPSSRPPSGTPR
jgi:hypothetical protein